MSDGRVNNFQTFPLDAQVPEEHRQFSVSGLTQCGVKVFPLPLSKHPITAWIVIVFSIFAAVVALSHCIAVAVPDLQQVAKKLKCFRFMAGKVCRQFHTKFHVFRSASS